MFFRVNLRVFLLLVLLQVLLTLLLYCLSIQLFCYVPLVAIFYSKILQLLLHSVVGMFLYHLPPLVGRFLSLFWYILFCLYCFILSRCLFNLPSFASTFWFISWSCIVLLFFLVLLLLFVPTCSSVFPLFYRFGSFS